MPPKGGWSLEAILKFAEQLAEPFDGAALVAIDVATGEKRVITSDERADVGGAMQHPTEQTLQAVSINYLRNRWKVLDASIAADFKYLETAAEGDFSISSRTTDDRQWIVAYARDNGPSRYYHYERDGKKLGFLFSNREALEEHKLAPPLKEIEIP